MNAVITGAAVALAAAALTADAEPLPEIDGISLTETTVTSSLDGSEQPVIVGVPDTYDDAIPTALLIGLHTWSGDYRQQARAYGQQAASRGWLLVLPNFRGPNKASNPNGQQAGGSLFAQHDIVDARAHMIERFNVDESRVYLTGDSGGGHMTMLMAGKWPDLWSAAAAWVPVTDLREWWHVQNGYAKDCVAVCGGEPGDSPEVDFEYARRSPRTFMTNLSHIPVLLGHGDSDGTIPVEQSWRTFRALRDIPHHNTLFYVFSGGHTGLQTFGLDWCVEQTGTAPPARELHLVTDESKRYYWADLRVADETQLATADIVPTEDALSVAALNLDALSLDLTDRPLPKDSLTLAVRSDLPLRLTLAGLPAVGRVTCEGDWARVLERSAGSLVLSVAPSEEARSLTIAW
ncbi:MAG: prolyl oligopeptidase family serine peptidase [Armatimonadia bacterium]|nr:prolyl oligopeptidase family serine peptidase [Armatimonadia bacterium]